MKKTISTGGPMLASNEVVTDFDAVQYPIIASPKLDGWRCYHNDGPRTRKGFILPNVHTRLLLMDEGWDGLDGELIAGSPTDPNAMQKAQSAFSSHEGEPDFTWFVFDNWRRADAAYWDNWRFDLEHRASKFPSFIKLLPQTLIEDAQSLERFSQACKLEGYEGAIIRNRLSPYKYGRSTTKQGWMLKVKPYVYEEAMVIELNEKMINANQLQADNFGFAKRSSAQAGKIPANTLGSFTIQDTKGNIFNVSTGHLTDLEKQDLWRTRGLYIGRTITFKHLDHGKKKAARHGQFVCFRSGLDQ